MLHSHDSQHDEKCWVNIINLSLCSVWLCTHGRDKSKEENMVFAYDVHSNTNHF